jgi:hypothetical protein
MKTLIKLKTEPLLDKGVQHDRMQTEVQELVKNYKAHELKNRPLKQICG